MMLLCLIVTVMTAGQNFEIISSKFNVIRIRVVEIMNTNGVSKFYNF